MGNQEQTKKVIFTAGAKGGTGKSTYLRHQNGWYQKQGIKTHIIDCDEDSKSTSRFFKNAVLVDTTKKMAPDVIIDAALGDMGDYIIVDMKAGIKKIMLNWFLDIDFKRLKEEYSVEFICVGLITMNPDSTNSFLEWIDRLQDDVKYLIVKNEVEGNYFNYFEEHPYIKKIKKAYRPSIITFPKIDEQYQAELEKHNILIDHYLNKPDNTPSDFLSGTKGRSFLGKNRLARTLNQIYFNIDQARELLI